MILLFVYAWLAGLATVLSPCALPLLPVLLAGSSGGRWRPWGIVAGFTGGFLAFALGFTWLVQTAGFPSEALRWVAGGLLVLFGLVTAVPWLQRRFQSWAAPLVSRGPQRATLPRSPRGGFASGALVGLGLGLAWTPCVGPIMASVLTLSLTQSVTASAFAVAFSFALGTGTAFLAVMLGGRQLLQRVPWLVRHLESIQRVFGVLMVVAGLVVLVGWDRDFGAWVLRTFPGYGQGLTAWEQSPAVLDLVQTLEP